jgi:hypothetical protein
MNRVVPGENRMPGGEAEERHATASKPAFHKNPVRILFGEGGE